MDIERSRGEVIISPVRDGGEAMNSQQPRRIDAVDINVAVDGLPAAVEAIDLGHAERRRRTICCCEDPAGADKTAGLPRPAHGIIHRLPRNKGHRGNSTAKLRPCRDSRPPQRCWGPIDGTRWELTRKRQEISAEQRMAGATLRFPGFFIQVGPQDAAAARQGYENLFREHGTGPGSVQDTTARPVLEYVASGGGA